MSDTEILGAQSRVGVTDGFGRYVVFHSQPVEGLAGCDGVVCFFLCVGGTAGIRSVRPMNILSSLPGFSLMMSAWLTPYMLAME